MGTAVRSKGVLVPALRTALEFFHGSLAVTNLVAHQKFNATAAFKPWFPKPAVRQEIDAREDYALPVQPYAFLDAQDRHWWVFYHRQKRLTHVLITRTSPATRER